ncbi:MAG TPA: type II secretion system protein [Pirellulales bacterium]|jgi:prepilin-type N-terminal cleavage/methylation domain-containing protein|nr:type II secretion system protein [Pirellulales bacterium]
MRTRDAEIRTGFTLLELVVTLSLLATFAAIAMARLGTSTQANLSASGDARRLSLDLLQAQRRAITTGNNHFLAFTSSGGKIVSYQLFQRVGASTTAADAVHVFNGSVAVTSSATNLEFQFDGTALVAYTITLAAPDVTYQVTVAASTGYAAVAKL